MNECKHEHFIEFKSGTFCFDPRYSVPAFVSICMDCRKTRREIELEDKLTKTTELYQSEAKYRVELQDKLEQAEAQAAVISKMACGLCRTCFPEDSQECSITDCPVKLGTAGAELLAELEALRREVKELRNGATESKQCE